MSQNMFYLVNIPCALKKNVIQLLLECPINVSWVKVVGRAI